MDVETDSGFVPHIDDGLFNDKEEDSEIYIWDSEGEDEDRGDTAVIAVIGRDVSSETL